MRDLLQHIDEAASVAAVHPCGLFVDIDGTLAPIQPRPEMAAVAPDVRASLEAAGASMHIAVLTGRSAADGRRIVGSDAPLYVGNHGIEWLEGGQTRVAPEAAPYIDAIRMLAASATAHFSGESSVIVEDKGATLSIHYRLAAEPSAMRAAILAFLAKQEQAAMLRISEGRRAVEARPPIDVSKGDALERIVRERGLAAAIAIGDDVTDIAMLQSVRALAASGDIRSGIGIAVRSDEAPASLLEAADYTAAGHDDVARFLRRLAERS